MDNVTRSEAVPEVHVRMIDYAHRDNKSYHATSESLLIDAR